MKLTELWEYYVAFEFYDDPTRTQQYKAFVVLSSIAPNNNGWAKVFDALKEEFRNVPDHHRVQNANCSLKKFLVLE